MKYLKKFETYRKEIMDVMWIYDYSRGLSKIVDRDWKLTINENIKGTDFKFSFEYNGVLLSTEKRIGFSNPKAELQFYSENGFRNIYFSFVHNSKIVLTNKDANGEIFMREDFNRYYDTDFTNWLNTDNYSSSYFKELFKSLTKLIDYYIKCCIIVEKCDIDTNIFTKDWETLEELNVMLEEAKEFTDENDFALSGNNMGLL